MIIPPLSLLFFFPQLHLLPSTSAATFHLDLVVVIHGHLQYWKSEMDVIRDTMLLRFQNKFVVAPQKCRLGLVANTIQPGGKNSYGWTEVVKLTDNIRQFQRGFESLYSPTAETGQFKTQWLPAMRVAAGMFDESSSSAKAILLLTHPKSSDAVQIADDRSDLAEVRQMREERGIYMLAVYRQARNYPAYTNLSTIIGDEANILVSETGNVFGGEAIVWMAKRFEHLLCVKQRCFFQAYPQLVCQMAAYISSTPTLGIDSCSNLTAKPTLPPPADSPKCVKEECARTCDEMWPLESTCEDAECGEWLKRNGTCPIKELNHCLETVKCTHCEEEDDPDDSETTDSAGATDRAWLGAVITATVLVILCSSDCAN